MSKILTIGASLDYTVVIEGTMQFASADGVTEAQMMQSVREQLLSGLSLSARVGPTTRSISIDVRNALSVPDKTGEALDAARRFHGR